MEGFGVRLELIEVNYVLTADALAKGGKLGVDEIDQQVGIFDTVFEVISWDFIAGADFGLELDLWENSGF